MSKREDERRKALAALGKIAERASETPWRKADAKSGLSAKPAPSVPPRAASKPPAAPPRAAPPVPARAPSPAPDAARARARQLEERRLKLEEAKLLKARRASELHRGANLEWRGMALGDVPTGIRRTAFDVREPSVSQKISDVLGDAREKEGRAKARAKGRRQGG